MFGVAGHPNGEVMRRRVLGHHSGSDDENLSGRKLKAIDVLRREHLQIQRLSEFEFCEGAIRSVGFKIVNLRKDSAQSPDMNRLPTQVAFESPSHAGPGAVRYASGAEEASE